MMDRGIEARSAIERFDAELNAFTDLAAPAESGTGHLDGTLVAVKDCFYDRGRVPTMGSRVHPQPSGETATVLERIRAAGADIVGYTNLHEWAIGGTSTVTATGPIHNPWNVELIAGGSSGGSAAALAAGLVDLALGTDTGGSIRIPAACCGVVGLKPTQDRVSTDGYVGRGGPTDQIGPMGRDVGSVRALFECLVGETLETIDGRPLRIGIARGFPFDNIKAEVAEPYEAALETIRGLGATSEIRFEDWDAQWWANTALFLNYTATLVAGDLRARPLAFQPDAMKVLSWGLSQPDAVIERQHRMKQRAAAEWAAMFEDIDVLISPTLPSLPPPIADVEIRLPKGRSHADVSFGRLCGPMNLAGVPCLSLPCGRASDMTVSLSITAAAGRDEVALAVGEMFEEATGGTFRNRTAELPDVR